VREAGRAPVRAVLAVRGQAQAKVTEPKKANRSFDEKPQQIREFGDSEEAPEGATSGATVLAIRVFKPFLRCL
jgi:hypothetical protein